MRIVRYILSLFVLVVFLSSCSTKARLRKADRKFECGEYYAASEIYRSTQSRLSPKTQRKLKGDVNFRLGVCYETMGYYSKAARAYTSAVRYKCADSTVFLNLGQTFLATGKYKEAKIQFLRYQDAYPDNQVAINGILSADSAVMLRNTKTRFKIVEVRELNSRRGSSFSPIFLDEDGSSVLFTSNRESVNSRKNNPITGVPNNDIYLIRRNNSGRWESASSIEGAVNTVEDEGVATVSADGKTLYFTRAESANEAAQIWRSSRSGGEWTEPQLVPLFADSSISCAHPALSPDGTKLYFVSSSPDGYGKNDIWVAYNNEGSWQAPTNLGPTINTEGNEMFPYVRSDGALFFASDGHMGLGGLDIYMAVCDSLNNWSVSNMGSPLNTSFDDFGICFSADRQSGFFSSNRNKKRPIDVIYSFVLPAVVIQIEGRVVDDKSNPLGESTIRLVGDNGETLKTRTKKDGSFSIKLSQNANYVMMASHRGYLNSSYSLNTIGLKESHSFSNQFTLTSISRPVQMDNIFYEFGKWTLTADSEVGLQSLVHLLNDNPNIVIEISAHTDMVGSDASNLELSQRRAQSVVDYLVRSGIAKDRIVPRGYGESQPVVVSAEIAKKHRFLKEGDSLSPEFIDTLTDEQREICNSINRRTEFKVIRTTYNLY